MATYDDILDIMQDEASADLLGMVGAGQDENVDTPWLDSVRMRLPWLIINMLTSAMSAFIVYLFEGSIADMALLAVLMPMVANQAGNTGQQALAVMIRQLATERFDRRACLDGRIARGKDRHGFRYHHGLACLRLRLFSFFFAGARMVMGAALWGDMVLGALAGGAIPLLFRAVGRDPAQASSIFLTGDHRRLGILYFSWTRHCLSAVTRNRLG